MEILVTGGAGFIGSNFVRYIIKKYPKARITVLDKLTYAGNINNLRDVIKSRRIRLIKGDICDAKTVFPLVRKSDIIVNFAAETHVDRSIVKPDDFIMTDVYGVYVLLEAARKSKIKRFIQISTDEVYGEAVGKPSKETDELKPKSPYAASKAGGDRLVFSYYCTYNIPAVITRCTNNYGPYQYPEKLVPLFLLNALNDMPLPVYGTGKNTRDWIYVIDHCRAIDAAMKTEGIEGETFNFGSGTELSVLDIAETILHALGKPKSLIRFVRDRPGHVLRHAVDASKALRILGWKPKMDFKDGINKTIEWYKENEWWWRPIWRPDPMGIMRKIKR